MKSFNFKTWLMLCLFCIVGVGSSWAETFSGTFNKITTTDAFTTGKYVIVGGSTANAMGAYSTYWASSALGSAINSQKSTITNPDAAVVWDITKDGSNYIISQTSGGTTKYVGFTGSSNNNNSFNTTNTDNKTKFTASVSSGTFTLTNVNYNSRKLQYNSSSPRFGNYSNQTGVTIFKLQDAGTPVATPTNLSATNVTATSADLSWNAVANASSYTVKIDKTEYTDINTNSYSATGLTAGTQYTWTVKAVGDGTNYSTSAYAANANFTTEEEQGGGDEAPVTFDNLGYASWGKSASFSGSTYDELSQTKSDVVFDYTRGSGSTYANTTSIRFYKDNQLKFTAPDGYKITSIVWTGSSFKDDVTTDVETCTSTTSALSWSGNASSVTFTRPSNAASYATLSSVSVTLEADKTKYDVTLNVNGGTINRGNITKYAEGTGATLPTDVTKTGYDFDGWFDNVDCTGDAVTTISSDATGAKEYWAKWTAHHHNVVFHKNDGASPEATTPQDYAFNETKNLTANTWERSGYNFTGWATTAEGAVVYDNEASYTLSTDDNVHLYAVWVADDAKAFVVSGAEHVNITNQPSSVDPAAEEFTINYTVEPGYEITNVTVKVGDATLTTDEYEFDQTHLYVLPLEGFNGDVVVTFTVEEIKWTVNFDYGTGSCSTESLTEERYKAGITLPEASAITAPVGTTFYGWSAQKVTDATAKAPTKVSLSDGMYMPTEDGETLYAVYVRDELIEVEGSNLSGTTTATKLDAEHPVTYKISSSNTYSNPLRIYSNNIVTITGATITKIVFDVTSGYDASKLVLNSNTGTIANGVWTKAADSKGATSVAVKADGVQVRVDKITVTYATTSYSSLFNPKAILSFESEKYIASLGKEFTAPSLNNPNEVEVTYTSSNEDVAAFEEGVLTIKDAGTTKITANFAGNASYEANKASYTLTVNYGTIAQIKELTSDATVKNFTINFEDAVVTYVAGDYAYLQDASAAVMVNFANHGLTAGKKINGIATGTIKAANQIDAIQSLDRTNATVTEDGVVPAAIEIALKDVDATYDGKLITVNGATVKNSMANTANSGASISDDGETTSFNLYAPNKGFVVNSTEVGNFTGFVSIYNGISYRLNLYVQSQFLKTQNAAVDQEISFATTVYTYDEDTEDVNNFAGQTISGTAKGVVTYAKKEGDDIFTSINEETGAVVLNGECGTATIEATAAATNETVDNVTQPYNVTKKTYTITVRPRYTVSFKNMDDTQAAEDIRQTLFEASITLPSASEKDGYRFLGWATTNESTTADAGVAGANYTPTETGTLFALYAQLHTAKFYVNGEQLGETQNLIAGESVVFPGTKPADKNGLTFFCWTNNEIDGVTETQPTKVTEATMSNDNLVFHAVFAKESGNSSTVDIAMDATSTTKDGVTIACAQNGSGNTAPAYTSNECRIYAKNSITISASESITAFSLTFHKQGSKDYISSMTASTGEYTDGGASTSGTDDKTDTWTGSATSITLTAGNSGQRVLVGGSVTTGSITYSGYCTTIKIKEIPTLSFAEPTYYAVVGQEFVAPTLNKPDDVSVSYSSSEPSVATVDAETGAVEPVAAGTTTITATSADNESYQPGSASYQLVVLPATGTLTMMATNNVNKYATFSSAYPVQFTDDDVTLYTVTVEDNTVMINPVDGKVVPANTGVLVRANNSRTEATYNYLASSDASLGDNLLYPASKDKAELDDCQFYMLAYRQKTEGADRNASLGFYWGAEDGAAFTSRVGSAYLAVPATTAPLRGFSFSDIFNPTNPPVATDVEAVNKYVDTKKMLVRGQLVIVRGGKVYDINGVLVK